MRRILKISKLKHKNILITKRKGALINRNPSERLERKTPSIPPIGSVPKKKPIHNKRKRR
jgi:hypothetical protein